MTGVSTSEPGCAMDNGRQPYHIHCNECYRRHCSEPFGCAMVVCERGCGSVLHACKLEDHNLICPRVKVACINALYGCPFVIERKRLSSHLIHCPVAMRCGQGWSRSPSHSNTRYPPHSDDSLDLSFALRDQMQLESWTNKGMKPLINLVPSFDAKLGWDELVMPRDQQDGGELEDEEEEREVVEVVVPPPRQFSADDEIERVNSKDAVDCVDGEMVATGPAGAPAMQVDLNITRLPVYVPSRHTINHFSCDQSFRRDEILSHYENVHDKIISHLGVWMEVRCPLALYGCPFTRRNLIPCAPHGSRVIFNRQLFSFGLQCMPSVVGFPADNYMSFLPSEILLLIFSFLDGFGLMSVALTCRRLRDVCCQLLTRRGVVEIDWRRDESSGKWDDREKRWFFSTAMSRVQWTLSDEEVISKHLLDCQFYKQQHGPQHRNERVLLVGLSRRSFEQLSASLRNHETDNS